MRKPRVAIVAAAVAAISIAGTFAFARDLFTEGEDDHSLAALVANLKPDDEPSGWDGGFGGLDECFESLPGIMPDGTLSPELAKFPAKLPGKSFELESLRFGHACGGPGVSRTLLQTNWRHKPTGLSLSIRQSEGHDAPERIAPLYASFTDGGYDFWLGADLGRDAGGIDAIDPTQRQQLLESALRDLKPPMPLECFYRNELRDWSDLAGNGIGDPRTAIPDGYSPIRLEFSVIVPPPNRVDCPATAPPSPGEPWVILNAMFSGPGSSLLSVHAVSKYPDDTRSASFLPGSAIWFDDRYAYSINWAPERVTDDQARAIAAAMDPKFASVCSLTATSASLADVLLFNIREPQPPDATTVLGGSGPFWTMGSSPACTDVRPTGFLAKWMFEVRTRGGLIEVTALRGQQMPNTQPAVFEGKTIYWKRADGVEFYVSGIKADFERATLLAVAASIDPLFDAAFITIPPGR